MKDGSIETEGRYWGPTYQPEGTSFRIWAPDCQRLTLRLAGTDHEMDRREDGCFEVVRPASPGASYSFVLEDGTVVPDPASRLQQGDVHGPSCVVDPAAYRWTSDWSGAPWESAVVYELHVGTFTPEGTFAAAAAKLPHLAETGVTAVEIMPVAQFAGNRGWGYDGVLPYAPHPAYGTPDEMKAFIDAAHSHGMMVLLDVVYNHFGPDGNYLSLYADDFFEPERHTPWGAAIAYEREPVREFFIQNALYWLNEFRLDGLRLDAIDHIRDPSEPEIMVELARRVNAEITDRPVYLTTEDNRNITHLHERDENGGVPLHTAEWNDDLHNVAHVVATHESDGYYQDFIAHKWEMLARSLAEGFAYQGETSPQKDEPRGHPSAHLPPTAFVDFIQNHDQVGNRAFGERLNALAEEAMVEALTAVLLLSPHIPLLFMGEEFDETRPFLFFCDFHGELAQAVRDGRRREFKDFSAFRGHEEDLASIPDPNAESTFEACKLDWARRDSDVGRSRLAQVRQLLTLRRERIVPHLAATGGNCGTVRGCDDGVIAVDWALDGALLQLRANLGEHERALLPAEGDQIYATPDRAAGEPCSVCVYLRLDT